MPKKAQKVQEDRRQFRRYSSRKGERIGFSLRGPHPTEDREGIGVLVNLGEGGVCMQLPMAIRPQQVLRLSLPLKKTTAPTLGEVCWIKREILGVEQERYWVGARYLF